MITVILEFINKTVSVIDSEKSTITILCNVAWLAAFYISQATLIYKVEAFYKIYLYFQQTAMTVVDPGILERRGFHFFHWYWRMS